MAPMILPSRPLRLRRAHVRRALSRAIGALLPAVGVLAVLLAWQGRAAFELARDMGTWERGEPVRVTSAQPRVEGLLGVARHVRIHVSWVDAAGDERAGWDDYYSMLPASAGAPAGLPEVRVDRSGGFAVSWSMEAAPQRWGWIGVFGLLWALAAVATVVAGKRGLRSYFVERRAARASDELELEVIELAEHAVDGRLVALEVRYRAPPVIEEGPAGYRRAASPPRGAIRSARFELAAGRPLLLDGDTRILALRPDRRSDRVALLSEGFAPFELDDEARDAALARLADRRARWEAEPPLATASELQGPASAPASGLGPESGMSTHAPIASKI